MKPPAELTDAELVQEVREVYGLPEWRHGFPLKPVQRRALEMALRTAEVIGQRQVVARKREQAAS